MEGVKLPLATSCFMEAWDGCYLIHKYHRAKVLTHWETTLKILIILLSKELEMEAGYGEGEFVQSFCLLSSFLSFFWMEKLWAICKRRKGELMMTWHLCIKFHALLRRLFTSSAHLFCHHLITCYHFPYWHDSFCPASVSTFFSTQGLNAWSRRMGFHLFSQQLRL